MSQFKIIVALLISATAITSVSVQAQQSEPGEEWRITMAMQMAGMSMPGQSNTQCIAKSQKTVAPEAMDKNCQQSDVRVSGNTVSMKFTCQGRDAMEGTGTFTTSGKSMNGKMTMVSRDGEMVMSYSGVNTGKPCDAKALERKANQAIAAGAATTDKMCTETATKGGQASMFFGKDAACKDPRFRTLYCANVKGESGFIMLRNEDKMSKAAKVSATIPEIERACGVSMTKMGSELCGSAEQRKSWKFLAQHCDVQAKVLAAKQCAGRSYTALTNSPFKDFCSAYAGGEASSGDDVSKSGGQSDKAAPAPEDKPKDRIKKGLKSVKGVFGG